MKDKLKKGRPKKAKEKQRERLTNKQKILGKNKCFVLKAMKEKKQTTPGFRAKSGGPSGHLTWPLNPQKKKPKKTKQNKTKQIRRVRAKWVKPSKKSSKKQIIHNKQETRKKTNNKTTQKYKKKMLFSYQSNVSFVFGGCPKFPFFDNLAKRRAHTKNTINVGVSARHFLENSYASRNGHLWKKQIQKFQLSFCFCLDVSFNNTNN